MPGLYAKLNIFRPGIKRAICKINNFSIASGICPKYYCTQLGCTKTVVEKFSLSELKIEKIRFLTESPTKSFFGLEFLTLEIA